MQGNLYIGADHRGFQLKEQLKPWLVAQGYQVMDEGNHQLDPSDDYPDFALRVAEQVAAQPQARGIVVCGSGIGVSVAANKVRGVRASVATSPEEVAAGRRDDDLNILALSADFISEAHAQAMITAFLETPYAGEERHARRLAKITAYEQQKVA